MRKLIIFIFLLTALSCDEKYEIGHFAEEVVNFSEVNSEYDDYNSTTPFINYRYLFHFSSNRNSSGKDFDIVGEKMFIDWSKSYGTLKIGTDNLEDHFDYLLPMFDSINTPCNELGPYSLGFRQEVYWTDLIMYASDCTGNYDIRFIYSELHNKTGSPTTTDIKPSEEITFLNTGANELYPTFYGKDFFYFDEWGTDAGKIEKILYCSDKEGMFNIYEVNLPMGSSVIETLKSDQLFESEKLSINSQYDDKCPYVNGKLLVFASNRQGGYGGFDLYYSIFSGDKWSEPINFGDKINTEYDEYRPITLHYHDFNNNLLIFSSNRPGGKGGFDLYHIGIRQMIQ
jgi:hypothetical protein